MKPMPAALRLIRPRHAAAFAVFAALLAAAPVAQAQATAAAPAFSYQLDWLQVPAQYRLGEIASVAVDASDNV